MSSSFENRSIKGFLKYCWASSSLFINIWNKKKIMRSNLCSDKLDAVRRSFPLRTYLHLLSFKRFWGSTGYTHFNALICLLETTLNSFFKITLFSVCIILCDAFLIFTRTSTLYKSEDYLVFVFYVIIKWTYKNASQCRVRWITLDRLHWKSITKGTFPVCGRELGFLCNSQDSLKDISSKACR